MSRRLLVMAVTTATAALLASASPAVARDHGFVHVVSPPSPDPLALYPGRSTEQTLWVQNKYGAVADLRIQALNVDEIENGCASPEVPVDDCASDEGELGRWLRLQISRNSPDGELTLWSGTFDELQQGIAIEPRVPAGGRPELRIVTTMDHDAGNDTMTDRVTYDLRFTLTSTMGKKTATLSMGSGGTGQPGQDVPKLASFVRSLDDPASQAIVWALLGVAAITGQIVRRRHP